MRAAIYIGVAIMLLMFGDIMLNDGRQTRAIQEAVSDTILKLVE